MAVPKVRMREQLRRLLDAPHRRRREAIVRAELLEAPYPKWGITEVLKEVAELVRELGEIPSENCLDLRVCIQEAACGRIDRARQLLADFEKPVQTARLETSPLDLPVRILKACLDQMERPRGCDPYGWQYVAWIERLRALPAQIVVLRICGITVRQIAMLLDLSTDVVERHTEDAYRRLPILGREKRWASRFKALLCRQQ